MRFKTVFLILFPVLYLCFMMTLVGEAELDGGDDLHHVAVSSWLSWKEVGSAFLWPRPAENPMGTGLTAHVLSNRAGQTLAIKVLYHFFGSNPYPYYLFQMGVSALCVALVSWGALWLTGSRNWAIFAALFMALLPTAFLHNVFLSDFAEVIHLCTLVSFACLYYFFLPLRRRGMVAAVGILSALYAVRTKPSGWIIPILFVVACALRFGRKKGFFAIGLAGLAALILLPFDLHLENILKMVFRNTGHEFESETFLALFNWNSILPVSLARNINFFFLWLAVFSGLVLVQKKEKRIRGEVLFVLAWFLLEVGFYAVTDNAPRYLTDALIPLILLLCVLFRNAWSSLGGTLPRFFFAAWFAAGLVFHVVNNFQHLVFLRDWKMGYFNELSLPVQAIYNDWTGRPQGTRNPAEVIMPFGWPKLAREVREKLSPEFMQVPGTGPALPELLVFSDVLDLYPTAYDASRAGRLLSEGIQAYGISYEEEPPDPRFGQIASFRRVPLSPMTRFLAPIKKKKRDEKIWVFRTR